MASPEPNPGDLIEIFRPLYKHWALYVGGGYVVHLAPPGENTSGAPLLIMSSAANRAIVKKELLSVVAGTDKYHVNNKHDRKYRPLPPSEIVRRAEELVGREMTYNLVSDNCEHFVNELRYGVSRSDQVTQAVVAVGKVAVGVTAGTAVGTAVGIPGVLSAGVVGAGVAMGNLIGSLLDRPKQKEQ